MRSLILSVALAAAVVGGALLTPSSAEARPWGRRGGVYVSAYVGPSYGYSYPAYAYPAYSYPASSVAVSPAAASYYYSPGVSAAYVAPSPSVYYPSASFYYRGRIGRWR